MPNRSTFPLPEILHRAATGQLEREAVMRLHAASAVMERVAISLEMLWRSRLLLDAGGQHEHQDGGGDRHTARPEAA